MFNQMRDCTYDANILDSWMMANPLIGEQVPPIEESVYEFMSKEDQKTFDDLDDVLRVYRAMSKSESDLVDMDGVVVRQSWTLNPDVAVKFANMPKILNQEERVIVEGYVEKSSIMGYINGREEEECIIKLGAKIIVERIHKGEADVNRYYTYRS